MAKREQATATASPPHRKATAKASKPPTPGARLLTAVPETLPLVEGDSYTGTLGAPKPGRYGISRTIMLENGGGKYWLPNHAALDPVFGLPQGSRVTLLYRGKTANKAGQAFNDWEAWALEGPEVNPDGLPF